jgi:hypothetical protein
MSPARSMQEEMQSVLVKAIEERSAPRARAAGIVERNTDAS